jgi:GPH family glycoside/pentoside/hexuronide:cation symporter
VGLFAVTACVLMAITAFAIKEKQYNTGRPHAVVLRAALKQTLGNQNFRLFIVADFAYFMAVTMISSGLVYFIEVLLGLPKTMGNVLMGTMVLTSFVFYPVFNYLPRKTGKKPIIIISLFLLAAVFGGVYFLGKPAIAPKAQIFSLILLAAIPVASLNILPLALLAEIIEEDSVATGVNKEALYFGVRYFFSKIAQTVGIGLFSMLLLYGKDRGHDFGIRLTGAAGFIMCVLAAIIFFRFKEQQKAKPSINC